MLEDEHGARIPLRCGPVALAVAVEAAAEVPAAGTYYLTFQRIGAASYVFRYDSLR